MMPDSVQAAAKVPLLEIDEERNAIRRWQDHGDREALELLIRSHARQAWSMAARYTDNPVHLEDLAAEGILGLIRAADDFDLCQDVRFSTYAGWWVMNGVTTAAARIRSVIDVPVRAVTEMRGGRLDEVDTNVVAMAMTGIVALDAPMGDGTASMMDALISADLTPEETATAESLHEVQRRLIETAMSSLNDEEAEIIRRRKLQPVPESLEDVADAMDMSRDRLRQVERRAMTRLRRLLLDGGFHRAMLN